MKAVTANRLEDGIVVYLTTDGNWDEALSGAALYEGEAAETALASAQAQDTVVIGVYLIDAAPGGVATGDKKNRETIRASGPTVRRDLGKQAGN